MEDREDNSSRTPRDAVVADLLITLHKIATMEEMAPLGDSGFVVGTTQTLRNCKREARDALRRAQKNAGLSVRGEADPSNPRP